MLRPSTVRQEPEHDVVSTNPAEPTPYLNLPKPRGVRAARISGTEKVEVPMEALLFMLLIVVLIASIVSISLMIDAGRAKGYPMNNTGILWFVGLFAPLGFIAVGLYINALPCKVTPEDKKSASPELPSL